MRRKINLFALLFTLAITSVTSAKSDNTDQKDTPEEVKGFINHHLKDAHYFELFHGLKMPLPIIVWDNGIQFFLSSDFKKVIVKEITTPDSNITFLPLSESDSIAKESTDYLYESKSSNHSIFHGKIVAAKHGDMLLKLNSDGKKKLISHSSLIDLSITKNVLMTLLICALIFFLFTGLSKSYKKGPTPSGFGRLLEPLVLFIRDDIAIPNIGEKHYKRYMSYLLTVFFFIWIVNVAGMTPLGINITGNIAITFSLALITYLITQFTANKNYWGHIFWMPGVPVPMKFVLMPIELLGTIIKPFSLMIRLYANITAGHVVLMSLIGLVFFASNLFALGSFFGLTLFLGVIELLVAFLQAYIFTMLTALYFGAAVEEHDDEH
ncbi:MAG: ATP synthase F0 subunit A [Flavobacteriales bacterium]|nr:ATP synthase F0 subunit A [Flavobacteriales bacterium]|tara:strand:+ start:5442 stop:6581 length:1140 start_codon:yes stop_codon:yes gene_type:complete